ncbi:UNVERIFIED_CONTAM: mRNA-decapping enzyme 1B [Siphonaria sp. JEL0065]|nr:mRNA-decapping enzyme 1B [Siphonaria sp. JEL0065]
MDHNQINSHNLKVLRRHDDKITDILDSTSHVVVYEFDEAKQSWTKRGIEGTLFIVQRDFSLKHRMMILNRLGLENLEVDLNNEVEFQVTGDYVIYRDPSQGVFCTAGKKDQGWVGCIIIQHVQGLWIYESQDRTRLAESLQEKCATSYQAPAIPEHPTTGINLMHFLMGNSNSSSANGQQPQQQRPQQNGQELRGYQPQPQYVQPITTAIPPVKHLQVLWSVLDTCLMPHHAPRSLPFDEFNARLARLIAEPSFQANLYEAYKTV